MITLVLLTRQTVLVHVIFSGVPFISSNQYCMSGEHFIIILFGCQKATLQGVLLIELIIKKLRLIFTTLLTSNDGVF